MKNKSYLHFVELCWQRVAVLAKTRVFVRPTNLTCTRASEMLGPAWLGLVGHPTVSALIVSIDLTPVFPAHSARLLKEDNTDTACGDRRHDDRCPLLLRLWLR